MHWNQIALSVDMATWEVTYELPTTGAKYHKALVEETHNLMPIRYLKHNIQVLKDAETLGENE